MAAQPTPTIGTIPTPPDFANRPATAHAEAFAMFNALKTVAPQIDDVGKITYANALSVELSAAVANATQWASGTYSSGAAVWSPIATAAGTPAVYIRKEPGGASPTDPANDPTNWVKYVTSNTTGGAVYTTSTTLTSGSPFAISISGGAGVWLKLPDATQLSTGIRHAVRNTGDNDLTVLDSTGATIGFIRPQCGTTIALSDSSTAAGKWVGDFEQIGVTADFQFGAAVAGLQNVKQIIQLDAVRTMVLTGGSNGQGLYAVVYDTTTQSAGAATLVRAAAYGSMAVKSAADQVLCVAWDNGNPGNLYATVLTISGTAITVNTAVTAVITGQFTGAGNWASVGGALCFSYKNASSGVVRAITISGTTPSIGAEQSAAASGAPRLYVTGSILRAVRVNNGSTVICTPYSVSGNTLTAGTAASTATAINETAVRSFQYQSGDIGIFHANGGYYVESIFKLTSTTEAVLSTNIRSHGTLAASSIDIGSYDYSIIDSSKIAFMCVINSGFDTNSINIVTNNSGSPSAGAAIDFASASSYVNEIRTSIGGEVGFILNSGTNLMYFDCSGVSPVRTRVFRIQSRYSGQSISGASWAKSTTGIYPPQIIINSKIICSVSAFNNQSYITPIYGIDSSGIKFPCKITPMLRADPTFKGDNQQSSWIATPLTTLNEGGLGVAFQRIQIAQV